MLSEDLARSLGRSPAKVREELAGMGAPPFAGAASPDAGGPFIERLLFFLLLATIVVVPLSWWNTAHDNFLLPQSLHLTLLTLAGLCLWLAGLAFTGDARIRRSPLYTPLVDTDAAGKGRDEVQQALHRENIGTGIHFVSVHLHRYYRERYGYRRGDFPHAEFISDRTISPPLSAKLTDEDVEDVAEAVRKVLG